MHGSVPSQTRSVVFTKVTENIISAIESGVRDFRMPWHGGILSPAFPVNAATDKSYRGINILTLWVDAEFKRYISGYWASYKQWQSLGAQVRKGERGSLIIFWKQPDDKEASPEEADNNSDEQRSLRRFVARPSYVFNVEQVDGWTPPAPPTKSLVEINEEVTAFVAAIGADVRNGGLVARYRRDLDCIEMPNPELFIGTSTSSPTEAYHGVLLHELTHWTGAPQRLDREFGKRFGDTAYAFEEIIAELGAAFLCSAFRMSNEPRPDHAAYVSSWLDILRRDNKAIYTAASKAQEAVQFLMELAKGRTQTQ